MRLPLRCCRLLATQLYTGRHACSSAGLVDPVKGVLCSDENTIRPMATCPHVPEAPAAQSTRQAGGPARVEASCAAQLLAICCACLEHNKHHRMHFRMLVYISRYKIRMLRKFLVQVHGGKVAGRQQRRSRGGIAKHQEGLQTSCRMDVHAKEMQARPGSMACRRLGTKCISLAQVCAANAAALRSIEFCLTKRSKGGDESNGEVPQQSVVAEIPAKHLGLHPIKQDEHAVAEGHLHRGRAAPLRQCSAMSGTMRTPQRRCALTVMPGVLHRARLSPAW